MTLEAYSGIVINQNQIPEDPNDSLPFSDGAYSQTFRLPSDYARGDIDPLIPDLTGFQVLVDVSLSSGATLIWTLDVQEGFTLVDTDDFIIDGGTSLATPSSTINGGDSIIVPSAFIDGGDSPGDFDENWVNLASGTTRGTAQPGLTWFRVYFPQSIPILPTWLDTEFRITVRAVSGIEGIMYSVPNPLGVTGQAFSPDGTPALDANRPISLMFRITASSVDSGVDFLGNLYRSAFVPLSGNNVSSFGSPDQGLYWMSQANPSGFAVESLYFDQSRGGNPVVIDRFTLDPITRGVSVRLYYSNDPAGPGTDVPSWENLLWTPVYKEFQADLRETFALPYPITARYIKVEFSRLQPRPYAPGSVEKVSTFKKFPKWVLDYYLARFASRPLDFVSSGVDITYNALDLAFTYYKGDLDQNPDLPPLAGNLTLQQKQFFSNEDAAISVDAQTLSLIRIAFQPFLAHPALLGSFANVLGNYAINTITNNYSVENITRTTGDTTVVSNLERDPLVIEKGFPVMSFFIPCRHAYRVSQAQFENGVAYFAGVKEIVFHREIYNTMADQDQYIESFGDAVNLEINDFLSPLPLVP